MLLAYLIYAAQPYEMCMKAVCSWTTCAKRMRKKQATLGEVLQHWRAGSVHHIRCDGERLERFWVALANGSVCLSGQICKQINEEKCRKTVPHLWHYEVFPSVSKGASFLFSVSFRGQETVTKCTAKQTINRSPLLSPPPPSLCQFVTT